MEDICIDSLKFKNEKSVTKILNQDETILHTSSATKFNEANKRQERNIMITNQQIYNLNKTSVTRKTALNKIYAVTIGVIGSEFVIHVPEEYDYRYASYRYRNDVILAILRTRAQIPIFFKEDIQLIPFTTTKIDKKKGICRLLTCGEILMGEVEYSAHINSENIRSLEMRSKTVTIVSKNNTPVALDDFHALKVLGRGAFGKVVLVEKKDTKELFAMKSLKKEDIVEDEQISHVKTEREVLETVQHPFLIGLIYAFQTPDKLYFVTQFMKGGELFIHLRDCIRFNENKARFYTAEILLAIEYLHSKKILFRDLKLENVLLDEIGHLRLTDYGLSKILTKQDKTQTWCGTPHYLAPELISVNTVNNIRKEKSYSFEIDWWALGICLYEFLFGIPPFYHKNQNILFDSIQKKVLVIPSAPPISGEAKDLLIKVLMIVKQKLLMKDPQQRLGSKKDAEEVKIHPWFKGVNWVQLLQKNVDPPFKPKTENDSWVQNFDGQFTSEQMVSSYTSDDVFDQTEYKDWNFNK